MKKILFVLGLVLTLGFAGVTYAVTATPSTNAINTTKGWAHVNQLSKGVGTTTLEFVNTRNLYSCFEYRTDGDTTQKTSDTNYNTEITDGLYPYLCLYNNTTTRTITAKSYVEVRMVFGGEKDERFDWTKFDVVFNRTAEITSPAENAVVSGLVSFDAVLNDKDGNDSVQWAVRKGTCAAGVANVIGNVDNNLNSPYSWDGANFHAEADTSSWEDGQYCFVFNPTESAGDTAIRLTREFTLNNTPDTVTQCKNDGWKSFFTPVFKNQGDCVSYIQSNENALGNKLK